MGLEQDVFGPASLRAVRVLAWRYPALAALPGQSGMHSVASPSADPSLRGRLILVADDDAEVRWFYVGALREAGARVIEARDGMDALELARAEPPDVILADIVMPRLDGLALCAAIRREPLLDGVPVVLLSWRDDFLHRMRELRADAQGYLRKEVPARQVLDRVLSVLEPLTQLERELKTDREAHGDLEELGVTRLLQAARRLRPNASIVLQDPWSLFDLKLEQGHIVVVTRTAIDGAVAQGVAALPALVGMSSGRIVVAKRPPRQPNEKEPVSLDDSFIEATRRLGVFLNTIAAHPDCRIEFDPDVLGTYVRHSPVRVQRLISALVAGGPPHVLWESGAGSRALVDALLITLARQGAIRGVTVPERVLDDSPVVERSPASSGELNEPLIEQGSRGVSDPIERQNLRAQSALAMHHEPANQAPNWSYPVWRLGGGSTPGGGESSSGFGTELQETPRLFGLAFFVLLSATVVFLIWNRLAPLGQSAASPTATVSPIEIQMPVEVPVTPETPLPDALRAAHSARSDGLDAAGFAGRLRTGIDPSLGAAEGQGALELGGPKGVSVEVDGVDRGPLPLTLVLDEGIHRVRYRLGAKSIDRFYYLKPGATRVLNVVTQAGGFVDAR